MSLIVNGTTVTKIQVIKDGVTTTLNELKIGNTVVFKVNSLSIPTILAGIDTYSKDSLCAYGTMALDTLQSLWINDHGIAFNLYETWENAAVYYITQSIPFTNKNNEPDAYSSFSRVYVGNPEGTPSYMKYPTSGGSSLDSEYGKAGGDIFPFGAVTEQSNGTNRVYIPVDYYYAKHIENNNFDYAIVPCTDAIPVTSNIFYEIGYNDDYVHRPKADIMGYIFQNGESLPAASSSVYEQDCLIVLIESKEMCAVRQAGLFSLPVDKFASFCQNVGESGSNNNWIWFEAYDGDSGAISYYFGDEIAGTMNFIDHTWDQSQISSIISYVSSVVFMDTLLDQEYEEIFSGLGVDYSSTWLYSILHEPASHNNITFFEGPYASQFADWPGEDGSGCIYFHFVVDKLPRGLNNPDRSFSYNRYWWFGAQAVIEYAIIGGETNVGYFYSDKIDKLKEIYKTCKEDDDELPDINMLGEEGYGNRITKIANRYADEDNSGDANLFDYIYLGY